MYAHSYACTYAYLHTRRITDGFRVRAFGKRCRGCMVNDARVQCDKCWGAVCRTPFVGISCSPFVRGSLLHFRFLPICGDVSRNERYRELWICMEDLAFSFSLYVYPVWTMVRALSRLQCAPFSLIWMVLPAHNTSVWVDKRLSVTLMRRQYALWHMINKVKTFNKVNQFSLLF